MGSIRRNSMLVLAVVGLAGFACSKGAADRPVSTITYSARLPRADSTATSSRTLDSTGYVDNGGRTSEQTVRTQMSGMRPTETGSERPTGTPGSGTPVVPVGRRPRPTTTESATALGGEDTTSTGLPGESVVARLARARCDRETACDRVGQGKPFGTSEHCMSSLRERARADVVDAGCLRGFDTTQLAICLNAIRQLACDPELDSIETVPNCQATAVCATAPAP